MAYQASRTDATTGATYPVAYLRIDDAVVGLANNSVVLTINTYNDVTAAEAGLRPVLPAETFTLEQDELTDLKTTFQAFLYALPRLRARYPDVIDV